VPGRRAPWRGGGVAWLGAELGDGGVANSEEKNEEAWSGVEEEEHGTAVLVGDDGGAALLTRELRRTTTARWHERSLDSSEARRRLDASSGHGEAAGELGDSSSSSSSRGGVAMEERDELDSAAVGNGKERVDGRRALSRALSLGVESMAGSGMRYRQQSNSGAGQHPQQRGAAV
jgi:hypothetical protein